MDWGEHYEIGDREGHTLPMERAFISQTIPSVLEITEEHSSDALAGCLAQAQRGRYNQYKLNRL